jgi:hypothetical protein
VVEELLLEEDAMAAATITAGPMMASGVNPKRSPPATPSGPAGTGVSSAAKATEEKRRDDARTKENFFMETTPDLETAQKIIQ